MSRIDCAREDQKREPNQVLEPVGSGGAIHRGSRVRDYRVTRAEALVAGRAGEGRADLSSMKRRINESFQKETWAREVVGMANPRFHYQ